MQLIRTELRGKNKVYICQCDCGNEKVFWKQSAISKQKSCGCRIDAAGLFGKQRRSMMFRFHSYKSGAKKRNFDWQLTYEQFVSIASKNCFYCNSEPKVWDCITGSPSLQKESPNAKPEDYKIKFNGIDRLNSKLGYTLENSVTCCTFCNRAKSDLNFNEFKKNLERTYKWLSQKEL